MTETLHTPRPSELVEHFLAEAISNSPQPLKDLALFLSSALSEDDWKTADRLLLALALRNRTSEPEAREGEGSQNAYRSRKTLTDPAPSESDDRLRVAVEALEPFEAVMIDVGQGEDDDDLFRNSDRTYARGPAITVGHIRRAAEALASLSPKEGGR